MWYVYILRSVTFPGQVYTGASANLKKRFADHNAGKSPHTAKYKPWQLVWYSAFPDKFRALEFENYLKSHSGRAFAKKRLT
jgi:predicted GIY-YIG superfamily endonuclease